MGKRTNKSIEAGSGGQTPLPVFCGQKALDLPDGYFFVQNVKFHKK